MAPTASASEGPSPAPGGAWPAAPGDKLAPPGDSLAPRRTRVQLVCREDGLHGRGRRLDGQVEVRAGVPVGDGIDVDRVDLLARPAQRAQRQTAPGTHRQSVEEPLRHLRHLRLPELRTWQAA
ncbi:hypothetical protein SLI_5843 [Streptomyces lividans 1326]|uniref:Uncharacterized protein n=1 Tax=Streptomyces lividans 1326 TaxID=1200984 RepID=A0A7U9DUU0_STRLI|nr:hypothetical protein SLI_5843 [Streptomyces lividans 1326]